MASNTSVADDVQECADTDTAVNCEDLPTFGHASTTVATSTEDANPPPLLMLQMLLQGWLADWDILLLVDFGASYNFLSKKLASQLGWQIHSTPTTKIQLANGDCVNSSGFAMGLISIGKCHAYVCFMVVDLAFDFVLSLPWFTQVNPAQIELLANWL